MKVCNTLKFAPFLKPRNRTLEIEWLHVGGYCGLEKSTVVVLKFLLCDFYASSPLASLSPSGTHKHFSASFYFPWCSSPTPKYLHLSFDLDHHYSESYCAVLSYEISAYFKLLGQKTVQVEDSDGKGDIFLPFLLCSNRYSL